MLKHIKHIITFCFQIFIVFNPEAHKTKMENCTTTMSYRLTDLENPEIVPITLEGNSLLSTLKAIADSELVHFPFYGKYPDGCSANDGACSSPLQDYNQLFWYQHHWNPLTDLYRTNPTVNILFWHRRHWNLALIIAKHMTN